VSGATKDVTTKILDGLAVLASKELKSTGQFTVPGITKLTVKMRGPTAARKGRNPATGEEIMIKAQPAKKVVRARVLKGMKEAV
jgi:DNA-binding protein HU-beta